MAAKRSKVHAECQSFHDAWTLVYFFLQRSWKSVFLLCHDSIGVNKEYNVKPRCETKHAEFKELNG